VRSSGRTLIVPEKRQLRASRPALVVMLCLIGLNGALLDASGPSSPTAVPTPRAETAPTPGPNGAIASLDLIIRTAHSEYFALTYWSDGLRVKGFLGRPTEGAGLPAVIFNRGGHGEFGELWGQQLIAFVEAGFVAVASQYRGACGSEGSDEFGGADVDDVLNLIPLLKGLPYVDPEQIGMMGWSRGGMMTYLALKQESLNGTHDIKAAVTVGGMADVTRTMWEKPGMMLVLPALIGKGPNEAPEAYRDRSAVFWPDLINAPLLILHGEDDGSVPVEQSQQLAELLAQAGKIVKLVTYPGDDHGLSAHHAGYPETLAWFQQFLGKPGEDHSFPAHERAMREVSKAWP
jgi:dipeptidyl aminopeptidase/acylaminoacyl peptidase